MAVVVTIAAPAVSDEDPPLCLFLTTVAELFTRGQSPSQAVCSALAMFWFWCDCKAEEKDLFLGSVLLGLARFLKRKMARLLVDLLSCVSCHRGAKGDQQPVTMSFSTLGGWCFSHFWMELMHCSCSLLCDSSGFPGAGARLPVQFSCQSAK